MIYPTYLPTQTAIDRARTSAQNGMRRAKADLDKMQAARKKAQPAAVLQVEPNSARPPNLKSRLQQFEPNPSQFPKPNPAASVRESIESRAIEDPLTSKKAAWRLRSGKNLSSRGRATDAAPFKPFPHKG